MTSESYSTPIADEIRKRSAEIAQYVYQTAYREAIREFSGGEQRVRVNIPIVIVLKQKDHEPPSGICFSLNGIRIGDC
jgi:hypothetical protein